MRQWKNVITDSFMIGYLFIKIFFKYLIYILYRKLPLIRKANNAQARLGSIRIG